MFYIQQICLKHSPSLQSFHLFIFPKSARHVEFWLEIFQYLKSECKRKYHISKYVHSKTEHWKCQIVEIEIEITCYMFEITHAFIFSCSTYIVYKTTETSTWKHVTVFFFRHDNFLLHSYMSFMHRTVYSQIPVGHISMWHTYKVIYIQIQWIQVSTHS